MYVTRATGINVEAIYLVLNDNFTVNKKIIK